MLTFFLKDICTTSVMYNNYKHSYAHFKMSTVYNISNVCNITINSLKFMSKLCVKSRKQTGWCTESAVACGDLCSIN